MSTKEMVQDKSAPSAPPTRPAWEYVASALGLADGFRVVEEDAEGWLLDADGREVTPEEVVEVLRGRISPATPTVLIEFGNTAGNVWTERFAHGQAQALLRITEAPTGDYDEDRFGYLYMTRFVIGAVKALNQALEEEVLTTLTGAKCAD